jgi:hypothetical protein
MYLAGCHQHFLRMRTQMAKESKEAAARSKLAAALTAKTKATAKMKMALESAGIDFNGI